MKTNFFSKKLPVWLILSGAIVIIGLVMFLIFGLNISVAEHDTKSVCITYDSYLTLDDKMLDTAEDTCMDVIKGYPVKVLQVKESSFTNGGCFEFVFSGATDSATLETVKDASLKALSAKEGISQAYYTASVNTYETATHATYVGRFVIAAACVLVVAFAYVAIRFRLFAGVTVAILALHDVLLTLALTALLRLPVSLSFIGAVGFSLAVSLALSVLSFVQIRLARKDENLKAMSQEDALEVVTAQARKYVLLTSCVIVAGLVVVALLSLIASFNALVFVVPAILAVIVSAYSSICMLPAIYMPLKAIADKRAAQKEAKYIAAEKKTEVAVAPAEDNVD